MRDKRQAHVADGESVCRDDWAQTSLKLVKRRDCLAVIKVMEQILIRSWKTKDPRFHLVQAVSAMKSSRVWKQVHPLYIGSPIWYDEGKRQKKNIRVVDSFL